MSTYVLQGVGYFLTHPRLWLASLCPLLLTLAVAVTSVVVLFAVAFAPQARALDGVSGVPAWLAWLLALLLVVLEIFLVTLIYSLAVLPCFMDKVFALVLTAQGFGELVEDERNHASCARTCSACCRVSVWLRIVVLVVSLPLNLVPVIGTLAYLWLNGVILAWEYHLYYFELKGMRYAEQKAWVDAHRAQYAAFGMQALFLEMIPGVGALFLFTNSVGAALFAADTERELRSRNDAAAASTGIHSHGYGSSSQQPHAHSQGVAVGAGQSRATSRSPAAASGGGYHVV